MHAHTNVHHKEPEDARIAALQVDIDKLQQTLREEDAEVIVKGHIKLLHDYNEAKDATQVLIGKLAILKETTVKQLHEDYGLANED